MSGQGHFLLSMPSAPDTPFQGPLLLSFCNEESVSLSPGKVSVNKDVPVYPCSPSKALGHMD